MKLALITPDRADRPAFLCQCITMMKEQTVKAAGHFIISHNAEINKVDIIPRLRDGIKIAIANAYTHALVIENDDYYPPDYIEKMIKAFSTGDIIGTETTIFYNLRTRNYKKIFHPGHSSLFQTGFKLSIFNDYIWPDPETLYFDMVLWREDRFKFSFVDWPGSIGIKHNIGFCPGNYHAGLTEIDDQQMEWLKQNTSANMFNFYKSLIF